jgi:hypothetical protein
MLKNQHQLIEEGWLTHPQLGFTKNGEPDDYLHHINLGALSSPWPERVSQSNQTGVIGEWNTPYVPGYRFYFKSSLLERFNRLVRTGAPFLKVGGLLKLETKAGYLGYVCSDELVGTNWVPDGFTKAANEHFSRCNNNILI